MKLFLLAICVSLGSILGAQSFQWDNDQPAQETVAYQTSADVANSGLAVVYPDYYEGNPTALGENYSQNQLTGAHPKLPLGTMVKVTRLDNGLSTTVRINDRGAYCDDCVIDLSKAAALQLKMNSNSRCKVTLKVLDQKEASALASTSYSTPPPPPPPPTTQQQPMQATSPQLTAKGGAPSVPVPNAYETTAYNPSTITSSHTAEPRFTARNASMTSYEHIPAQEKMVIESDADIVSQQKIVPLDYIPNAGELNVIHHPISEFAVQLGSYSVLSYAERHARKLDAAGFNNVFLLKEKKADGSSMNRVIIAPFDTIDEALDYQDDLDEFQPMKSLILQAGY